MADTRSALSFQPNGCVLRQLTSLERAAGMQDLTLRKCEVNALEVRDAMPTILTAEVHNLRIARLYPFKLFRRL